MDDENRHDWGWEVEDAFAIVGLPRLMDGSKLAEGQYTTIHTRDFSDAVSLSFDEDRGRLVFTVTHLDDEVEDESDDERWHYLSGSLAVYTGSNAVPESDELFFFGKAEHIAVKSFVYQGTVFYAALAGHED